MGVIASVGPARVRALGRHGARRSRAMTNDIMRRGFLNATADAPEGERARGRRAPSAHAHAGPHAVFPRAWTSTSSASAATNALVLLHGDLDHPDGFERFGRALNLPSTVVWSLGGTLNARGVEDDGVDGRRLRRWVVSADEGASAETRRGQLARASRAVRRALRHLRDACGWELSRVHVFGFSDGGAVALDVAARMTGRERLGSCAVVAAALPEPERLEMCDEAPTPVMLVAGTRDEVVPIERVRETAAALTRRHPGCGADVREFDKTHAMVSSVEETRALMEFWAKTLTLPRAKASDYGDDVVELSAGAS